MPFGFHRIFHLVFRAAEPPPGLPRAPDQGRSGLPATPSSHAQTTPAWPPNDLPPPTPEAPGSLPRDPKGWAAPLAPRPPGWSATSQNEVKVWQGHASPDGSCRTRTHGRMAAWSCGHMGARAHARMSHHRMVARTVSCTPQGRALALAQACGNRSARPARQMPKRAHRAPGPLAASLI